MSCDVGEVIESLENEQSSLPLLHLRHSSFSNPSFASPTSQDFQLRHLASRLCLAAIIKFLGALNPPQFQTLTNFFSV